VDPTFFAAPSEFRAWLEEHHAAESELLVGFYKKGSGRPSMTWPESVDEALCFGWIDGVRRSIWSVVNVRRARELIEEGRMRPAGLAAFEARTEERSGVYSFEQKDQVAFDAAQAGRFQADAKAWEFFQAQPPWYRRTATWWVISAKKEETRAKRLATLIEDSAAGRPIRGLDRRPKGG
jgi:uncharacterized protein YdeI (YjbR/CyaY-like superfamily)